MFSSSSSGLESVAPTKSLTASMRRSRQFFREELRELDAPDLAAREAKDAMRSLGDGIVILDASNARWRHSSIA
jgi:hypothetical protein